MFRNLGDWKFKDVTGETIIKVRRSYQNAFADFDNDGRIDLLTSGHLFRNITQGGDWLEVSLQGKAPNTCAIGAKVIVECNGKKFIRQVESGTSNGNQNDIRLHFGLGKFRGALNLKVIWPNGKVTEHIAKANSIISLKQK
jgi:hypothetical protein